MKKLIILALMPFALNAFAQKATTNVNASASLNGTCSFSAAPVAFGDVLATDPMPGPWGISKGVTTKVLVLCSNKQAYTLKGQGYKAGGYQYLKGTKTADQLAYWVYRNAPGGGWFADGGSYAWTGGTETTFFISGSGTGTNVEHTLYFGLMHMMNTYPKRAVTPDSYSDTYTLTLTY